MTCQRTEAEIIQVVLNPDMFFRDNAWVTAVGLGESDPGWVKGKGL